MKRHHLIPALALLLLLHAAGLAQSFTATLTGTVSDPNGALVANATVIITNTQTGIARTITTNAEGRYVAPQLQPSSYEVSAEASGFQKITKSGIQLEVNQTAEINIQLAISGASVATEVVSASLLLQTEQSSLDQTVEQKLVEDLPLVDQNVMQLVQITPGVVSGNPGNPSTVGLVGNRSFFDSNFSVNGGRGSTNDVLIDGVSNTVGDFGGVGSTPPAGSIQEFKVLSGAISSEFGRTGGGVVSYITKPGGNVWHGSAYEFHQNSELNANGWFNNRNKIARVSNRRNHFGGALSGPVWIPRIYNGTSKTFFFVNYEGRRNRDPFGQLYTVPTLKQRQGDFSETKSRSTGTGGAVVFTPVTIYNPFTTRATGTTPRDAFANNVIPASLIDPVAAAALKFYPDPNRPADDEAGSNNYVASGTNILDLNYFSLRVDHNFSSKQNLFARFTRVRREDRLVNPFNNVASSGRVIIDRFTNATINHTYSFTTSLVNNFRYGYTRAHANQVPFGFGYDPTQLGLPSYLKTNAAILQFPTFNIGGNGFSYTALGSRGFNDQPRDTTTVADGITKVWRGHTIRTGAEYRLIRFFPFQVFDTTGNFSFTSGYTQANPTTGSASSGFGLASFLLGAYSGASYEYGTPITIFHHYFAGYLQDDWKVNRRLTLNMGLRWDRETGTQESGGRLTTFDFRAPSPLAGRLPAPTDPVIAAARPNFNNLTGLLRFVDEGEPEWAADSKRFAPRIGLAYQMNDKTVVRAGYALFYLPVSVENLGSIGFNYTITSTQPDARIPQLLIKNPFPSGLPSIIGKSQGSLSLIGQPITAVEDRIESSYNQMWNLSIQRQIGRNLLAEIAYVGSRGVNLPLNSFGLNQLDPKFQALGNTALAQQVTNPFFGIITDPTSALRLATVQRNVLLRPFPQYTGVTYSRPLANMGDSSYHGLQLKLQKRFAGGLSFLTHYTWSKSLDIGGTGNGIAFTDPTPIQNIYNIRDEWSLSTQDVPHRYVMSGSYELPFGQKKRFLGDIPRIADLAIGGWKLSGTYTWQSGTPLAITADNRLGIGNSVMRASLRAGQDPRIDISTARDNVRNGQNWFNVTAFFNANDEITSATACGLAETDDRSRCFRFGNVSRTLGSVRRDNYINLDLSLFKIFRITEKMNFEFRAESFNTMNYVVFGTPTLNVNNAQFGKVTTQLNTPRRVQLAAKITF